MQASGTWRRWLSKSRPGGNTVAAKLVNFTYNADGQYTTISRYANLAATQLVATSTYGYNSDGQITSLSFRGVGQPFEADQTSFCTALPSRSTASSSRTTSGSVPMTNANIAPSRTIGLVPFESLSS
jgi:hypothetical protein